jgi:hypothetical protein
MPQPFVALSRQYKPGDFAPLSGIYAVTHAGHRPPHEVLAIRGEEFPPCRTCRLEVTFEVVRSVDHLTHDLDFAGPVLSDRRPARSPQGARRRRAAPILKWGPQKKERAAPMLPASELSQKNVSKWFRCCRWDGWFPFLLPLPPLPEWR